MRISDWSSDVCSSDLMRTRMTPSCRVGPQTLRWHDVAHGRADHPPGTRLRRGGDGRAHRTELPRGRPRHQAQRLARAPDPSTGPAEPLDRSEEHTSELQSLMRISYAVVCLKKKKPMKA